MKTKLINTRLQLENLDIKTPDFDAIKNLNIQNKNKNLETIQKKIEELKNKIYYAKQAADAVVKLNFFVNQIHHWIILDQRGSEHIELSHVLSAASDGSIPKCVDYIQVRDLSVIQAVER